MRCVIVSACFQFFILLRNVHFPRVVVFFCCRRSTLQNLRAALESLALLGATDAALAVPSAAPPSSSVADGSATKSATPSEKGDAVESSQRLGGTRHAAGLDPQGRSPSSPNKHKPQHTEEDGGGVAKRQSPTATATTTTVFEDATARAPLTPLGRVLSALPVDPSVGKMLALGALFGESEHVLTLAAALSTQTPFDARASASASGANPVAEFASPNGKQRLLVPRSWLGLGLGLDG